MSGIIVRLPDGSTVQVPTDDPQKAAAAARTYWQTQQASRTAKPKARSWLQAAKDAVGTATDFAGDVLDNVVPNWGDEITGASAAASRLNNGQPLMANPAPALLKIAKDPVGAIGEAVRTYQGVREGFKRRQADYDKTHPKLATASTVAGTVGGILVPVGRAAQGATRAARIAEGAAVGAGFGGVAGAGQGESLEERSGNAAVGLVAGGVAGAALPPLAAGGLRAGRWVANKVPGGQRVARGLRNVPRAILQQRRLTRDDTIAAQADRVLVPALNRGNLDHGFGQPGPAATPASVLAEVERRQDMGVPAIPGDVSEPLQTLTGWASRGMGPGQTRVREAIKARKAEEANRVRQHVVETMGETVDPHRYLAESIETTRRATGPAYQAAYAQPMVVTDEIASIMQTPAFRDALPQAVTNIRNGMGDPEALGFRLRADGSIEGVETLSTEGFDQVIRAMRDNGRAAMDTSGFVPRDTTNSVHINNRARDLRGQLAEHNEAYRDVTARYADDAAQRDAFAAGQDVERYGGHDLNALADNMREGAAPAWSIGVRSALANTASEFGAKSPTGDTAEAVRRLMGDDTKRSAMSGLMGNDGSVRSLLERLEAEGQGNRLYREAFGNSHTANRQQVDEDLAAAAGTSGLPSLTPMGIGGAVVRGWSNATAKGNESAIKDRVAAFVAESDPEVLQALSAAMEQRAASERTFQQGVRNNAVRGGRLYGIGAGSRDAEPYGPIDDYGDEEAG